MISLTDEEIENLFDNQLNTYCSDLLYSVKYPRHKIESFSSDISLAFKLITFVEQNGFYAILKTPFRFNKDPYICGFTPHGVTGWNGRDDHCAAGSTMEIAICKAFLRWSRDYKEGNLTERKCYEETK